MILDTIIISSWDLPRPTFGDGECILFNCNINFAFADVKDHVHLSRILLSLVTIWRYFDKTGVEEWRTHDLAVPESSPNNIFGV